MAFLILPHSSPLASAGVTILRNGVGLMHLLDLGSQVAQPFPEVAWGP